MVGRVLGMVLSQKPNKHKHTDQFSAALQIARCCGRYAKIDMSII